MGRRTLLGRSAVGRASWHTYRQRRTNKPRKHSTGSTEKADEDHERKIEDLMNIIMSTEHDDADDNAMDYSQVCCCCS